MSVNLMSKHRLVASVFGSSLGEYVKSGTNFVTSPDQSIQVGILHKAQGEKVSTHQHRPTVKNVTGCQEVIIVTKGQMKVDVYSPENEFIASLIISPNQIFVQYMGGHSFEVMEDVQFIEIKQGPHCPEDKIYFNPMDHENMK